MTTLARRLRSLATASFVGLGVFTTGETFADNACLLSCIKGDSCKVKEPPSKELMLSRSTLTPHSSCNLLTVVSDKDVLMRYRSAGKWFQPTEPLETNKTLSAIFAMAPPDTCSVPNPTCLQQRMNGKTSSKAGHGIDDQVAIPAGTNEPCALGLPCGMVLPQPGEWRFRFADGGRGGQWRVSISRGAPPAGVPKEFTAAVAAGVVTTDGRQFAPGSVYAYHWLDASGKDVASGEFEVMSASGVNTLKRLAAKRAERDGTSEPVAWLDTLANSELDWDVAQALQGK